MEIARIIENKPKSQIYGLMGNIDITTNNSNYKIINDYKFKGTVKEYLNSKKDSSSLKMVMLDSTYLDKTLLNLSEMEIKLISLAKALIENKDYLVLDYFEKGLNHKEKEIYKRLFRKLTEEYNKTIVLFTNDITFLWDIASEIIVVDNQANIKTYSKEEYLDIPQINKPEIIELIDLILAKKVKIKPYKNVQDLLKAIYRLKGD